MAVIQVSREPNSDLRKGLLATTIKGSWKTLTIFLKQLFRIEKTRTLEWPDVPADYSSRFKGAHFLTLRPDGQVRCTACFLCATNCPAQCITIVAGDNPDKGIEKFPVRFEIDILRCVFCGYCEEACPVDAIRMGPEYALGGGPEEKWIYTIDHLLNRRKVKDLVGDAQQSRKPENLKQPDLMSSQGH